MEQTNKHQRTDADTKKMQSTDTKKMQSTEKNQEENKTKEKNGAIRSCLQKTALTPKLLLSLVVASCVYFWLYVFVGPGCLGSLIFVACFVICFACVFFFIFSSIQSSKPTEKQHLNEIKKDNKKSAEKLPKSYQSEGAEEESYPLTSKQAE